MAVTNTVRAVLNTTTGRWFLWDRDGDRFEALPANGVALTATGAGTNAVHVYRIIDDRGQFQPMVATADDPATLKVYVKDPDSGNMALKETVSCTSFADDHCEFVLAGDYAAETTKYVRLDFADGTAGSITASFSAVTLYEQREGLATPRVGTWRILSAAVSGIDDKRVKFESSNPAVCRIERGTLRSSAYINMAESPQQTDEYCVLVGVASGTATITCTALGDGSTATVAVDVKVHPDDEKRPASGGTLAAEVTAMLHNVRCPIRLIAPIAGPTTNGRYSYINSGLTYLWMRTFAMPGDENDWFDIALNFSGLVPKSCFHHTDPFNGEGGGGLFLVFATATRPCLGITSMFRTRNFDDNGFFAHDMRGMLSSMECVSGAVLNDPITDNEEDDNTSTINRTLTFRFHGGETFVLAWLFYGNGTWGPGTGHVDLPYDTNYHALVTVSSCAHHPANEAP